MITGPFSQPIPWTLFEEAYFRKIEETIWMTVLK